MTMLCRLGLRRPGLRRPGLRRLGLRRLGAVALLGLLPLLAACNTVEGMGRDVQATGKAIERGAR